MANIKTTKISVLVFFISGALFTVFSQEKTVSRVFEEKGGCVVIETETLGSNWEDWKVHDENSIQGKDFSGYSGTGYIGFYGNSETSGSVNDKINYKIKINDGGKYNLIGRAYEAPFESNAGDKANDCYIAMPAESGYPCANKLTKWVRLGGSYEWTWGVRSECNGQHNFMDPWFTLDQGEHTFQIAGRSKHFFLDKFVFYKDGSMSKAEAQKCSGTSTDISRGAASPANPEFTVVSNPISNQVTIRFQENMAGEFTIYSAVGKAVWSSPVNGDNISFSGKDLKAGIYTGVLSAGKRSISQNFIVFQE